jgi:hypothetical protein
MSRKHFRLITKIVAGIQDTRTREQVARALAVVCASANPRFDVSRFLSACGVPAGTVT